MQEICVLPKRGSFSIMSMLIPNVSNHKIFIWTYLLIEDLVMSPLNSLKGISIAKEMPYGTELINILRMAVLRQYYGRDVGSKCLDNGILRYSYGHNKSNSSVKTDMTNYVTKPFSYYLLMLSSELHCMLVERREELGLVGVDLSTPFNHCTSLLYYADKDLNPSSKMPFHCDISYNHSGKYVESKNEQVENTLTVIVSIGDNRDLYWQCQICMVNTKTGRLKWYDVDKTIWCKTFVLEDKTVLIVNTLDERPVEDPITGCLIRYQHGKVNVTKSAMTCGLALRVVKNAARYNDKNKMIIGSNANGKVEVDTDLNLLDDYALFHKHIKKLFMEKF